MTCNFISGATPGRDSHPVTPGILHRVVRHRDPSHWAPSRDWKAGLNTSHLSRSPQRPAAHGPGTSRYIRPARPVLKQALSDEFELTSDLGAKLPPGAQVDVFHGLRDETAPPSHAGLYAAAIPQAQVHRLPGRDHQLNNDLSEVAEAIRISRPRPVTPA